MPFLGIEIGGTKLQLALGLADGRITQVRRLSVESAQGAEGIRSQIERELPSLIRGTKIEAVGVGFGGPVDWRSGKICTSHQIEGWSGFELAAWMEGLCAAPAVVENDANTAARAEAALGAGMGFNPVFYVTLGSGVGGGLVVDGRIYHGDSPGEAEIGHVRLDRSGISVEDRCSGWAVDARIRSLVSGMPESSLAQFAKQEPGAESKHLAKAVSLGDSLALSILHALGEDLAFGLSHVVHLVHPQVIVLGGGLAGVGEPLRAAVERSLTRFIMKAFAPGPKVALAGLGSDAVPAGALLLAGEIGRNRNSPGANGSNRASLV
jgi:glucokinase